MDSKRRSFLRKRLRRWLLPVAAASITTLFALPSNAADIFVTSSADSGAGSLRQAMLSASSGDRILFAPSLSGGNSILLANPLPVIRQDITIDASNNSEAEVHGLKLFRPFFVESGNVEIKGLTITQGYADGGDGGDTEGFAGDAGTGGGGGGLGAGGAIFVDSAATVTLTDVTIEESTAEGGDGGQYDSSVTLGGGGGGGGLGGDGGVGAGDNTLEGGGGGGGGVGGDGGDSIFFGGGGGGGEDGQGGVGDGPPTTRDGLGTDSGGGGSFSTNGGTGTGLAGTGGDGVVDGAGGGGGGGVGGLDGDDGTSGNGGDGGDGGYGGGGGGSAANSSSGSAGDGGTFGGGGGAGEGAAQAGDGGFGGGGGGGNDTAVGGDGGFGGGGGAGVLEGFGGSYGGDADATGGGGGAALGGAIFVNQGGTLILNNTSISESELIAGEGAGTAGDGSAKGESIFLNGSDLTLQADSGETHTISQTISDSFLETGISSNVTKAGAGTVILNGDQDYNGLTTVNDGTLLINGSILGDVLVSSGTLGGDLTTSGSIFSADRLAAGNSIGTMTTGGDLFSFGTLEVEIAAGGNTPGVHNEFYDVGGTANLTGGNIEVSGLAGEYVDGTQYTFLTAGSGIVGTPTISDTLFFFDATLDSTSSPGSLIVQINANGNSLQAVSATALQQAIAQHLEYVNPSPTTDFLDVLNALIGSGPANTRQGLNEISGQIYPTMVTAQLQQTSYNLSMLRSQLAVLPPCGNSDTLLGWVRGFSLSGDTDTDSYGASGFDMSTSGTEIAFRNCVAENATIGGFVNLATSDVRLNDVNQFAKIDTTMFGATLQVSGPKLYSLLIGGVGIQDYEVTRQFTFIDPGRQTRSDFGGNQAFAYIEQGMQLRTAAGLIQPFVALQGIYHNQERFLEDGPNSFSLDLRGNSISTESLRGLLGISFRGPVGSAPVMMNIQAAWMHEYLDAAQEFSSHSYWQELFNDQTTQVQILGNDVGRDFAILGAGINWQATKRLGLIADYQHQISSAQRFHVGSGGVQVIW